MIARYLWCNLCGKRGEPVIHSARMARIYAERQGWGHYRSVDLCDSCCDRVASDHVTQPTTQAST